MQALQQRCRPSFRRFADSGASSMVTVNARQHSRHVSRAANTVPGFSDSSLDKFCLSVIGDLHLAPEQMHLFNEARSQLVKTMSGPDGKLLKGARIVQLGDLGHTHHRSGCRSCFDYAKDYMEGFGGTKVARILGNHDLEGEEFETDEENLAAWVDVFKQPHYWSAELGPALLIGLSTTRYRSNKYSHHEVYICDEQVQWFEQQLEQNKGRPILVFTHAPPIGCGLRVIQNVHIKNRCAWLNHSDRPERFMDLVNRHPQVKLWFSGHFHLSHNYLDSISTVGSTAFVQTGVIGECTKDDNRHSRVLMGDKDGYKLYTIDHGDGGSLRLDMAHAWADPSPPSPCVPEEELVCDPFSGWLCSKLDCKVGENNEFVTWYMVGHKTMVALQNNQLVEYDMATRSPIGLLGNVVHGCEVRLVDAAGNVAIAPDGTDVAAIEVVDSMTGGITSYPRNEQGCFYKIIQHNKWRLRKEKEEAEKAQLLVAA